MVPIEQFENNGKVLNIYLPESYKQLVPIEQSVNNDNDRPLKAVE